MTHKIHLTVNGDTLAGVLRGEGRAPSAVFDAQRVAFRSSGFEWGGGGWFGPRDSLPRLVEKLTAAGIPTVLPEELVDDVTLAEPESYTPTLPEGFTLFAHQTAGIDWLRQRARRGQGALLADDMGLGKTAQTLLSVDEDAPVLVVAPAVAKGVWARETRLWRPTLDVVTLSGRGSFRWPRPGEVVVTNFDILAATTKTGGDKFPRLDEALELSVPKGLVVVVDEAHKVKNSKAKRTQSLRAVCALSRRQGGRTVLLTGTPVLNTPQEVWTILVAADLHREAFPGGWAEFAHLAGGAKGRYGMTWENHRIDEVGIARCLSRVQLRRRKDDVLDLPGKLYESLVVDVPRVSAADAALNDIANEGIDLTRTDLAELSRVISFGTISKARAALAKAKIKAAEAVLDDLEEAGEGPVVVFSAHLAPAQHLAKRVGWALITGDTSSDERTAIEVDFQAGRIRGIAATIKAAGVALTLTAASRVLFVDEDWTPANNEQAEDRCYRIGQTRTVVVTTLVADHPLDRHVAHLLARKRTTVRKIVEAAADAPVEKPEHVAPLVEVAQETATEEPASRTPVVGVPFTDTPRGLPQPREDGTAGTAGRVLDVESYETLRSTQALATVCAQCGRPLRDALSQQMGIGPKCRRGMAIEDGLAIGRREANVLIWAMLDAPAEHRLDVDVGCDRLAALGFGSAASLRERFRDAVDEEMAGVPAVKIDVDEKGAWVVYTPYSQRAVVDFREIPGRRWARELRANVIPRAAATALHDVLRRHWAGQLCQGARGQRFYL